MDSKEVDEVTRRISVLVEAVRSDVRIVAEGLSGLSGVVGELRDQIGRLENRVETLDISVRAGFDNAKVEFVETRAMIKLSYTELDRRLGALESGYSELRERIERLEGSGS